MTNSTQIVEPNAVWITFNGYDPAFMIVRSYGWVEKTGKLDGSDVYRTCTAVGMKSACVMRFVMLGASLGTSLASIVAAFDERVRALALLSLAPDFAEIVWTGTAADDSNSAAA